MIAEYQQARVAAGGSALSILSENIQLMEDVRQLACQKRWSQLHSETGHFILRDAIIEQVNPNCNEYHS